MCRSSERPIIFLDIDGVLITKQRYLDGRKLWEKADPACVEALNHLLGHTGADIIVSSAWRGPTITPMQRLLAQWGVHGRVIDVTPSYDPVHLPNGTILLRTRASEIAYSLAVRAWHPFIILDDEDDGLCSFGHRFIQTTFEAGLTMAHVARAIEQLRGNSSCVLRP